MSQHTPPTTPDLAVCVDRLANLPDVYMKVLSALDDAEVSSAEVADVIATDPSLTAALLRMARLQLAKSSFYGYTRTIESIQHAVRLVGLEQVRELVLAASMTAMFDDVNTQRMNAVRLWGDGVRRGMLVREAARTYRNVSRAYSAALSGRTRIPERLSAG